MARRAPLIKQRFHQHQVLIYFILMVFGRAEGTSGWGAPRTANIRDAKVFGRGYLGRKCSVFFAVW